MAHRLGFILGALLLAVSVFDCSVDSRKLKVNAGPDGGMTLGDSGSGGDSSVAGTTSTAGSTGVAGTSGAAGTTGGGLLGAGSKCSASADCMSGPCLDGICCAAACTGPCVSCAGSATGQADGACSPVQAGSDPHDDCTKGSDVCGLDGQCDGSGKCRFAVPDTSCGTEACASNQYTPPAQCDGTGKCVAATPVSCGGQPCIGTRCDIPCSATVSCPTGLYCSGTTCAAQKTGGSKCAADTECSTNHCAEGVCCDGACNTKCNSCLQANTGQTDGKCSTVRAGVIHGTDCPGAATCPANSASYTTAPSCDGAGACKAGTAVSCGNYYCNATTTTCPTACSANAQCATAYCAGGVCKTKTAAGGLCSGNAECLSGTCSGRCCASGTPCMCPQPSAGNLVKNPGFDSSLTGWTVDSGPAIINWQPGTLLDGNGSYADANACPYSGAAYVDDEGDPGSSQLIWQCVTMALNTSYDFDAQIATLAGAQVYCDADLYQGPGCTGGTVNGGEVNWINVGWSSPDFPVTFNSSFYLSAKISCHVEGGGGFYFDDVYLTPAPGQY
jgi:hypothetical protein